MSTALVQHSPGIHHVYVDGVQVGTTFRLDEGSRPSWTARTSTGRIPRHRFDRRASAVDWLVVQHRPPHTPRRPPEDAVLAAITAATAAGRPETGALVAAGAIIELTGSLRKQRANTGAAHTWAALDRITAWARAVCATSVQIGEISAEVPRELHAVVHQDPAPAGGTEPSPTSHPAQIADVTALTA